MYSPIVKKDESKMKNNMTWSIICGIGWLTTLILVSIELFKDVFFLAFIKKAK